MNKLQQVTVIEQMKWEKEYSNYQLKRMEIDIRKKRLMKCMLLLFQETYTILSLS